MRHSRDFIDTGQQDAVDVKTTDAVGFNATMGMEVGLGVAFVVNFIVRGD